MGGTIWIESEPGNGSSFIFTIKAEQGSEARPCPFKDINVENLRILMADDDETIREYFGEIIRQFGLRCDFAVDGNDAVEFIKTKGPYDLCFIDWKMPGLDGVEVCRKIREREAASLTDKSIVVLISAADWTQAEQEAKKAGVDKFIAKPLFSSVIADTINQFLGNDALSPESSGASPAWSSSLATGSARPATETSTGADTESAALTAAVPNTAAPGSAAETSADEDNFEGHTIILAEDVEINREIVLTLLEDTRLGIDCAENGAAALRLFRGNPDKYDFIFMDVHMPEMDGFEATRRIRALDIPRAKTIPIVAMTANVFKEDIEKCLESGMNDHVGKPLDIAIVLEKLRQYLPHTAAVSG
jgi:CheY-like chemotaxis protein